MNGPDKRNQDSTEDEHDSLFLNDTKIMIIVVMEFESFNHDGHQGSSEEHTKCILESEWEVLMSFVIVLFKMCEIMENIAHNEFVEEDDSE